ncbi:MAG: hypothetical protein AAFS07_19145 [Pseudomonadota bacterium]
MAAGMRPGAIGDGPDVLKTYSVSSFGTAVLIMPDDRGCKYLGRPKLKVAAAVAAMTEEVVGSVDAPGSGGRCVFESFTLTGGERPLNVTMPSPMSSVTRRFFRS